MSKFFRRYWKSGALVALFALAMPGAQQRSRAGLLADPGGPSQKPPVLAPPPAPSTPRKNPPKDWHIAEEFDFDWQGNGTLAHFKIEQSHEEQMSRLTINFKDQVTWIYNIDDALEEFTHDFLKKEDFLKKNKNLLPSKYAFALVPAPTAKPLIFLVTPQYGSDPGTLFVLALGSKGPEIIFSRTFHIKEFRDLGDGRAEMTGLPCFSQEWGHDFLTYGPFHVYQLKGTPPALKLSLPLTQEYNLKHYYGWAGPDCSEDLTVILHPPGGGKPVIVKTAEAKELNH